MAAFSHCLQNQFKLHPNGLTCVYLLEQFMVRVKAKETVCNVM